MVERREPPQVVGDAGELLVGLPQQPFGYHEGDVLAGDAHLLEAVTHSAQLLGHEREARAVKQRFLESSDEAEGGQGRNLAELTQEAEVQDQLLLTAGAQVVQQLVHDEQDAVVRVALVEGGHGLDDRVLVVGELARRREPERRSPALQRHL